MSSSEATKRILADIYAERDRQHKKWGTQRHDFPVWITVLTEEVGEVAQAVLRYRELASDQRIADMRAEAIQVATVAVAMIEHMDEVLSPPAGAWPEEFRCPGCQTWLAVDDDYVATSCEACGTPFTKAQILAQAGREVLA